MLTTEQRKQALFADNFAAEGDIAEKTPVAPLTLDKLQVVTVHYDLFSRLQELSKEKDIDFFIYKRVRQGRYMPKHKYYYSIVAVKKGTSKANHVKNQENAVAIVDLATCVNHRRNSSQYKKLTQFCAELDAYN